MTEHTQHTEPVRDALRDREGESMTLAEARSIIARENGLKRSTLSRITAGKEAAPRIWATRRARYGETGRRPVDKRLRAKLAETGSDKL